MKILVINCGSSSVKYQLINMEDESVLAKGNYEKIGAKDSFLTHKVGKEKFVFENEAKTHDDAIKLIMQQLVDKEHGVISNLNEIDAIGHRIVHGGEKFTKSMIVDDDVIEGIKAAITFAPLHNPGHLQGIYACQKELPNKPNVVVFDTAFHQTMPKEHYIYPIPYKYYEKYGVRKYGAHGTSHYFVSRRVAELLNKPVEQLKIVVCHLGQGASLCAVYNGKSVDTSMGLTPLGGIPMCARSGDLDPSVVTYIMKKESLSSDEMENILNKESGMYGLSGISADFRDIESEIDKGNQKAKLALEIYYYRVAQYIVQYAVPMQGIDVIVFTAGVGENQYRVRYHICEYLKFLGVEIDKSKNNEFRGEGEISSKNSKIKVYVVPTNEELMIARDTQRLINNGQV